MRRAFVLTAVLLVGGVLPSAGMQFCAPKKCCQRAAGVALVSGCCHEVTACAPASPDAELASQVSVSNPAPATVILTAPTAVTQPVTVAAIRFDDHAPPMTRRLATLSILLI